MAAPARGREELTDAELRTIYEDAWHEPGPTLSLHDAELAALRALADTAVARFADATMLPPEQ